MSRLKSRLEKLENVVVEQSSPQERVELWIPSNGRDELPLGFFREIVSDQTLMEAEYRERFRYPGKDST